MAHAAGEGRLKLFKDNLLLYVRGERSSIVVESGRGEAVGETNGPGDDGRLAGRKIDGFLSTCIIGRIEMFFSEIEVTSMSSSLRQGKFQPSSTGDAISHPSRLKTNGRMCRNLLRAGGA